MGRRKSIVDELLDSRSPRNGQHRPTGYSRSDADEAIWPGDHAAGDLPRAAPARFPLDALPEPVCGYVDACSTAIDCDAAFVALPIMTIMAGAIGNTRRLQLKRGWSEPAILWSAIVGESGTQKSPALDHAREFPRKRQAQAMLRYKAALAEFEVDELRYQAELTAWKRKGGKGEPPEKPERPIPERSYLDNCTIEAVLPILLANWRGAMVLCDELAGWLGAFDRYAAKKGGEASKWLEMHGGRSIVIDRKTGIPPTIYVPRAALSVCGGIQPGSLRRLIGQEHKDNGLLARLLMAWPERRPRRWTEAEPADELTAAVSRIYDALWQLSPTVHDGEHLPVLMHLTPAAKEMFVAFVNTHGQEQYQLDGDLAAAWSKLEGYAARFALVHCLVRLAYTHNLDDEHLHVDQESMGAGIALVQWFAQEDRRIYGVLEESRADAERRELVELILRNGGTMTARQLCRASRRYTRAEDAEAALTGLATAGRGVWVPVEPGHDGGAPTRVFRLL